MSTPDPNHGEARRHERRQQMRMLLLLALAAVAFSILRAHPSRILNPGWWHLW